ncbi:MAG: ion transporter [Flammeovirgaceae bacterium]|jgi:voltage-gated potassium channel|nr:ion transporter [Flammeovirgaceae bacterium]|tara:strand:- start:2416 stop:3150 length:735 start_codon:yes stop_codon:yes gene_type:complete
MKFKNYISSIVEDNTTLRGKIFDYTIQGLILFSLVAFSLETLPNNSEFTKFLLNQFEVFCICIFIVEYLLRLYVAPKPIKYIFSFYGIIDVLAIVPFFLRAFDLRFLRAFRIFRIFRALKLIRYNKAINRFNMAMEIVKEELILFFIVILILIFIVSAGIYFFENEAQPDDFKSIFHSAWWSIVTLTTVGYGDVYPITLGGKIFTFFVLIIGVGVVTIPAGLIGSALSQARDLEIENDKKNSNK